MACDPMCIRRVAVDGDLRVPILRGEAVETVRQGAGLAGDADTARSGRVSFEDYKRFLRARGARTL